MAEPRSLRFVMRPPSLGRRLRVHLGAAVRRLPLLVAISLLPALIVLLIASLGGGPILGVDRWTAATVVGAFFVGPMLLFVFGAVLRAATRAPFDSGLRAIIVDDAGVFIQHLDGQTVNIDWPRIDAAWEVAHRIEVRLLPNEPLGVLIVHKAHYPAAEIDDLRALLVRHGKIKT